MKMREAVIVVGADHYNTLWLARSLGMGGFIPIVVVVSSNGTNFVKYSKYCGTVYQVSTNEEIIDLLESFSFKKVPIISSSDETARIIDLHYDRLKQKYILPDCFSKGGMISELMNKEIMLRKASDANLKIPSSILFDAETDSIEGKHIIYPCLIKPANSSMATKDNFRICTSERDLNSSIDEIKSVCKKIIIQEYIDRQYEYLIYGLRTPANEIVIPGGLKKIHYCNSNNNLGMMTYAYASAEVPKQLSDFSKVEKFLDDIDYHGIFSIEFIVTKESAYFLEINLRNDGTCYIFTQAGVNIPALWAATVYNQNRALPREFKRKRTYGLNEINYLKYTLRSQSICRSICEFFRAKAFSLIKWDDLKPFFAKLLIHRKSV